MYFIEKTDFILNDPNNDIIMIDNKAFKIHGVIFHDWESTNSGHYISLIRKKNSWIKISDKIITTNNCWIIDEIKWRNNEYWNLYKQETSE